jgi:methylated-DNA-[protein]-cysteine S-methyltransferase
MTTLRRHVVPSPLGPLTLVADDADRLCGLYLPNHRRATALPPIDGAGGGVLGRAADQLDEYFAGGRTVFELPLATVGSPLQARVWAALGRVRYGTTTTYGRLAAELGLRPGAARAVGTANARNPLSIVIPCHRVVGTSGSLTGYAGGLAAKRHLLDHEAQVAAGASAGSSRPA